MSSCSLNSKSVLEATATDAPFTSAVFTISRCRRPPYDHYHFFSSPISEVPSANFR